MQAERARPATSETPGPVAAGSATRRAWLGALAVLFGLACAGDGRSAADSPATAAAVRCEASPVTIRSASATDARLACLGAQDAIKFLAAQGLDVSGNVAVELVARLPLAAGHASAGIYLEPEARVVILSFAEFVKFRSWFKIPINVPLYRSLVSHEVAHALAAANFRVPAPSIQAKEYIAYVTMMATMPAPLRQRILALYPGRSHVDEAELGTTIYMLDPMRFGVQSYRHFLQPGNGRDFLRAILSGKALVE